MNELQQTQRFQKMIRPAKSQKEVVDLYINKLVVEEKQELIDAPTIGNILKEAGDLIVVSIGVINALGADAEEVLKLVNESNMSKLCVTEDECLETKAAFSEIGIKTYTLKQDECYGVYSSLEQKDINGKLYSKDKLLKPLCYAAVDESELAKLASIEL